MRKGIIILVVLVVIAAFAASTIGGTYNRLVALDERVNSQWAQVESQLQRRWDLIPNLVETVKGYAAHEQEVFKAVADARSKLAGGGLSVEERVEAANQLESALARLLVIVENYPQLKADQTFIKLQDELTGTENRLSVERMRYNEAVQELNRQLRTFPTVLYARLFGFDARAYFEAGDEAKNAPKVNF